MEHPELAMQLLGQEVKVLDGSGMVKNTGFVKEIYNDGTCMLFNPNTYVQYFYADLRHCDLMTPEVKP